MIENAHVTRGYLWEQLREEIAGEFIGLNAHHPAARPGSCVLSDRCKFIVPDSAENEIDPWDWRRNRNTALATGVLPARRRVVGRPSSVLKAKVVLRELREERKRSRDVQGELPKDRSGTRLHFKILVRDNEQPDGSAEVKAVDGYLTMNTNPDGLSLREIFITVGKAGSSDALLDEWAKQVSNRLQEGCSVEQVFRTHVGTRFGDFGAVQRVAGITSCTSVLDLVSRIAIARYGAAA